MTIAPKRKGQRTLLFGKNAKITIRSGNFPIVKRNVYFQNQVGTFIIYNNKRVLISYTRSDNSGFTL
jgi:hypothetical protein